MLRTTTAALLMLALLAGAATAGPVALDEWLVTPAVPVPHADLDGNEALNPVENLLETPPVDPVGFWPAEGRELRLAPGRSVELEDGGLRFELSGEGELRVAVAQLYLDVPAWQEGRLVVRGAAPFRLLLDEEKAAGRGTVAGSDTAEASGEVVLDQGRRRLFLVTALSAEDSLQEWSFQVRYEPGEEVKDAWRPRSTREPEHPFDITDYYLDESVTDLELTDDGRWLAAELAMMDRAIDGKRTRLEVWDVRRGERVWDYESARGVGNLAWRPDGEALLFSTGGKEGTDLYLWHREDGSLEAVARSMERAGGFLWAPDGSGLYYRRTVKYEEENEDYKVMWGLQDRWAGWRNRAQVRFLSLDGGGDVPLADLLYGPDTWMVTPDGGTLVLVRSVPDEERPFQVTQVWTLDTETGEAEKVYQERFQSFVAGGLSPDGGRLAFAAPRLPVSGNDYEGPALNYYDRDLWVLDLASGEAEKVTPDDFGPAVDIRYYGTGYNNTGGFLWHESGLVVFPALYMKKALLCTWDPGSGEIEQHRLSTPGFSDLAVAREARVAAWAGDVRNDKPDLWAGDWRRGGEVLVDLNERFGRLTEPAQKVVDYDVTYWDHEAEDSVTVQGYLYYPRDYDPEASYPLVVDTYGGVIGYGEGWIWGSQVYANRGYFCYIPVPRGAAGYGSAYADTHPNDWGLKTSRDMNNGVRHITRNVPGADSARVGFVSGSYGGFLAMYLLAMEKDDPDYFPYATTISDYGISNLVSYWGVGWWGYLYSDMASAGSWPWNAADLYRRWSPIYRADNITAPLLLIHGEEDVNVPVMESDQMYTALKVLGRDDVVFVRFPGEDHGIRATYRKYLVSKRMHIEWFDKWLRDRPGAWDHRMDGEMKK